MKSPKDTSAVQADIILASNSSLPAIGEIGLGVLLAAAAGGLGWGIRGQYGHETGAMIAGLLVSIVIVRLLYEDAPTLWTARAIARTTLAIGFGGSMTYGQTIGLTQDRELIGNWEAFSWGMFGLAIKGAIWIGFAGAFLGASLSGVTYRWQDWLLMMTGLIVLRYLGIWLWNEPFDPQNKVLPYFYFSDNWIFEPDAELKPRREVWGGLLVGLTLLLAYLGWAKKDSLATMLGCWGILGGAIGFPAGQSIQAFHAWNPAFFSEGILKEYDALINWWNFMEITFGCVMGGALGLGAIVHRRRMTDVCVAPVVWSPWFEWVLVSIHLLFLIGAEFTDLPWIGSIYDEGLYLALLPVVAISAGRNWPFLQVFFITAIPIAGKTIRQLVFREESMEPMLGVSLYGGLPLTILFAMSIYFSQKSIQSENSKAFLRTGWIVLVGFYFCVNFAFFRFPWPWLEWTSRTPSGLFFFVASAALILLAGRSWKRTQIAIRSY